MTLIAVTGASGFLGSRIVELLVEAGANVNPITRDRADIRDGSALRAAVSGDVLIHAAGLAHSPRSSRTDFDQINVLGTLNAVEAAAAAGMRRVVLVSSIAVHSGTTAYAHSKREAEVLGQRRAGELGLECAILRMATVYGEHDRGNFVRLIRSIDRRTFVWIGPGTNRKTLIYRDDAARSCIAAAMSPRAGGTYDVATSYPTTREIVDVIASLLDRRVPGMTIPGPLALAAARAVDLFMPGDRFTGAISAWLREDLYDGSAFFDAFGGSESVVPLREGLAREVAWYRHTVRRSSRVASRPSSRS